MVAVAARWGVAEIRGRSRGVAGGYVGRGSRIFLEGAASQKGTPFIAQGRQDMEVRSHLTTVKRMRCIKNRF